MLMAAGLILLMWTVAFSLQYRHVDDGGSRGSPEGRAGLNVVRLPMSMAADGEAAGPGSAVGSPPGWHRLSYEGMGRRCLPDMGGYTDLPVELDAGTEHRQHLMRRIWVN